MKTFLTKALLGSVLALCAAGTASANQLLVFVTVGDILTAASSKFTNCNAGMTDCGVYAVGFYDAKNGTAAQTATSGLALSSPVPTGSAKWVSTILAGGGPSGADSSAWEAGGTANGNTQIQFMTNNTSTIGDIYDANLGGNNLTGIAAMNVSTQIGFLLNFSTNVAAGTTTDLRLRVLVTGLNASSGVQDSSKNQGDVLTISGATLSAVPEPSSLALIFAGIAAIGFARRRRRLS